VKAVIVEQTGDPSVLRVADVAAPSVGPTDLLVDVHAAGVNFIDVRQRRGVVPTPLPMVPGVEGAGVVRQVGAAVVDFAPGDQVAWASVPGTYAQQVAVPADRAARLPNDLDMTIAGGALLQGLTAHYLIHATTRLEAGQIAVVHSAAGGVGSLLVQYAKRRGVVVIGTVGGADKIGAALQAGADHVVDRRAGDFVTQIEEYAGHRGCDAVFDGIGAEIFHSSLRLLRRRGTLAAFGEADGTPTPVAIAEFEPSLSITRTRLRDYIAGDGEFAQRARDVLDAFASGVLRRGGGEAFDLEHAATAHRRLESGESTGKLVLAVADQNPA
jgi:NADPH2:quinone reductase